MKVIHSMIGPILIYLLAWVGGIEFYERGVDAFYVLFISIVVFIITRIGLSDLRFKGW